MFLQFHILTYYMCVKSKCLKEKHTHGKSAGSQVDTVNHEVVFSFFFFF